MITPDIRAAAVRRALSRGDLLGAYDAVVRRGDTENQELNYLEVLTLARLGDTARGLRLYEDYSLASIGDVDSLSLKARLLKDLAYAAGPVPDLQQLQDACMLYVAANRRTAPAIRPSTPQRSQKSPTVRGSQKAWPGRLSASWPTMSPAATSPLRRWRRLW